ncbi:MAG: bifunctional proline dehydrogenase/L-glutamate gamma-semialdehyde dehydrogenase PutA [bacterium]
MSSIPPTHRENIRAHYASEEGADEALVIRALTDVIRLSPTERKAIAADAAALVQRVRDETDPSLMESFLQEYGLSTSEGVGLMCLAEALLRVPDEETIDDLIQDKIEPSDWGAHLGQSTSPLINASTWALMLTGKVLDDDPTKPAAALRSLIRRVGEPVVRTAVAQAMKLLGSQFVLGETIEAGLSRARELEDKGYTYSYDMLGEAARTEADAVRYHQAYASAIARIAAQVSHRGGGDVRTSPGISVKLSALHPRYEYTQRQRVMAELVPRVIDLAQQAAAANIGFNIDAEEQERLDLSLDVIEALMAEPTLARWAGLGIVVQAYGKRAAQVIDALYAQADQYNRQIMVRLVKGAYWDSEIKLAQELGVASFPVFTRKVNTDLSYMACAQILMDRRDRIYPQFATHNAHTCMAVLKLAGDDRDSFEFQRLHGMGESLHEILHERYGTQCRIYAPVGAHRDLLAYLVRRLLENGANSSFVNQIVDEEIPPEMITRDPVNEVARLGDAIASPLIRQPLDIFAPRRNSKGYRVNEPASITPLLQAREAFKGASWIARPMITGNPAPQGTMRQIRSPADPNRIVGEVWEATTEEVHTALAAAETGFAGWRTVPTKARTAILRDISDLYEAHIAELTAITTLEAGKTVQDSVAEVREAVDFLRFYADEAERLDYESPAEPCGVFVCISPWNFPLAIFTGQVAAALAAGNTVVAKPAEQTPLIAARAVELMRTAGLPEDALQLLPGDGPSVGGLLTAYPDLAGVCFTGSLEVAQIINRSLAENTHPDTVLIAETGGLNAMLVDSTALTEQAVRDILTSAFQSAGQRCSSLRMLYVQEEARARLLTMLYGAMETLTLGDPWQLKTDVSPVIDAEAQATLRAYIAEQAVRGRVSKQLTAPDTGTFVAPTVIEVDGIADLDREVFGPVLHVASFQARDIDQVVDDINVTGYGLTFGLHTRIDDRVQQIVERIRVGNVYVNRNQIGAIVGSQPFGGEGLSGTGPKAGGPHYVQRFRRRVQTSALEDLPAPTGPTIRAPQIEAAINSLDARNWAARPDKVSVLRKALAGSGSLIRKALAETAAFDMTPQTLPGPTGESNRLTLHPRGVVLCLGLTVEVAIAQAAQALGVGCGAVIVVPDASEAAQPLIQAGAPLAVINGHVQIDSLAAIDSVSVVSARGNTGWLGALRRCLASKNTQIVSVESGVNAGENYLVERHICIDTTAAGGNVALIGSGQGLV